MPEEQRTDINPSQTLRITEGVLRDRTFLPRIPGEPLEPQAQQIAEQQPVLLTVDERNIQILSPGTRYLAAVYLANETPVPLREDFRARALLAGIAVVALSVLLLPLLRAQAVHLWEGLTSARAAPVVAVGVAAALLSDWALLRRRYRLARSATVVQTAAAPPATLRFVLWSLPFGMALLLPSLWLLFRAFEGEHLSLRDR